MQWVQSGAAHALSDRLPQFIAIGEAQLITRLITWRIRCEGLDRTVSHAAPTRRPQYETPK